jgi:hypothetical protein
VQAPLHSKLGAGKRGYLKVQRKSLDENLSIGEWEVTRKSAHKCFCLLSGMVGRCVQYQEPLNFPSV